MKNDRIRAPSFNIMKYLFLGNPDVETLQVYANDGRMNQGSAMLLFKYQI